MVWDTIKAIATNVAIRIEQARAEKLRNEANSFKEVVRDHGLTCHRCQRLAVPIYGTPGAYRCLHCSNQFHGRDYSISRAAWAVYDVHGRTDKKRARELYEHAVSMLSSER